MKKNQIVIAIHEASGQDITFQDGIAYALAAVGGMPGQSYPVVLIVYEKSNEQIN